MGGKRWEAPPPTILHAGGGGYVGCQPAGRRQLSYDHHFFTLSELRHRIAVGRLAHARPRGDLAMVIWRFEG
jgi:hypothetical protein